MNFSGRSMWNRKSLDSVSDDHEGSVLAGQFKNYAEGTSIHGIKYTCEPGRSAVEKVLWVVLCIFSVVLTLVFMIPQFNKMKNSPFITSVETTNHPIWNIDFPAVTICSNNKVMDKQLRQEVAKPPWNNTHLYNTNDTKHQRSYEAVKGVLERYVFFAEDESTFSRNTTDDEEYVIKNQSRAIPSTLRKVMHRCKDMMLVCLWQGKYTPCTELFAITRTDSGFCCSFNAVNQKDQFADSSAESSLVDLEDQDYYYATYADYAYEYIDDGFDDDDDDIDGGWDDEGWFGEDDIDYYLEDYGYEDYEYTGGDEFESGNDEFGEDSGDEGSGDEGSGGDSNTGEEESGDTNSPEGSSPGDDINSSGDDGNSGDENSGDSSNDDNSGDDSSVGDEVSGGDSTSGDNSSPSDGGSGSDSTPSGDSSGDTNNPSGDSSGNDSNPSGDSSGDTNNPSGDSSGNDSNPSGDGSGDTYNPSGDSSGNDSNPSGDSSGDTNNPSDDSSGNDSNPSGDSSGDTNNPSDDSSGNDSNPSGDSSGDPNNPSGDSSGNDSNPSGDSSGDTNNPSGDSSGNDSNPSGDSSGDTNNPSGDSSGNDSNPSGDSSGDTNNPSGDSSGSGDGSGEEGSGEEIKRRKRSLQRPLFKHRRPKRATSTSTTSSSTTAKKIRKSNSASTFLGLSVLLYPNSKAYNVSLNNYYGFKILVHSPYSFPEPSSKGFAIGQGTENFIGVSAQLTESTDAVKNMDIERRKCIRHDEDLSTTDINLEAFLQYSRDSCLLECRAKLLYSECGCLPYYYPDFAKVWGKPTACDFEGLKCIGGKTKTLYALNPESTSSDLEDGDLGLIDGASCNCPNECDEIIYTQEMSSAQLRKDSLIFRRLEQDNYGPLAKTIEAINQAELDAKNETCVANKTCKAKAEARHKVLTYKLNEIKANSTFVHIYFKELGIIKYTKDQIYGPMDALAAFGGIVGLCMGFSILSGFELIYYFTLRLFIDRRRKREEMKAGT